MVPRVGKGLLTGMFVFLTGCPMEKPSGEITVKESPKHHVVNQVALSKIMRVEGFHGMDFYNGNQLLIRRDNQEVPSVWVEGELVPSRNLYLYDLDTKEATLINGAPMHNIHRISGIFILCRTMRRQVRPISWIGKEKAGCKYRKREASITWLASG